MPGISSAMCRGKNSRKFTTGWASRQASVSIPYPLCGKMRKVRVLFINLDFDFAMLVSVFCRIMFIHNFWTLAGFSSEFIVEI